MNLLKLPGFFQCNDLYLFSTQPPTAIKWSQAQKLEKKIKMGQQEAAEAKTKWRRRQDFSLEMAGQLRTPFSGWGQQALWVISLGLKMYCTGQK